MKNDLHAKITGNTRTGLTANSTLEQFANVWAPASDNNNPTQYAEKLAKQLGVSTTTSIGALASRLDDFAHAIASNEGFQGLFTTPKAYAAELPSTSSTSTKPRYTMDQLVQMAKTQTPASSTPSQQTPTSNSGKPRYTADQLVQMVNQNKTTSATPPAPTGNRFLKGLADYVGNKAKDASIGVAQGEIETVQGAGQGVLGVTDALGVTKNQSNSTFFKDPNALQPKNLTQGIGKAVGVVAPYLTGAGEEDLVLSAGKVAEKVPGIIGKGLAGLVKAAPGFVANTAVGTAQAAGNIEKGLEVGVGGEIAKGVGAVAKGLGKGIYKASIPTSATEANLLQAYRAGTSLSDRMSEIVKKPVTSAETAFRKGMMGTESMIGIQARKASSKLWNKIISPALEKSGVQHDMSSFFDEAAKAVTKDTGELGDQADRLKALEAIKEEYSAKPTASTKEIQAFKKGWASHVPQKAYRGQDITAPYNYVRNVLAGIARSKIYEALGKDVKQAYLDYGNMEGLQELGQKAMTGAKLKGGAGSFISGLTEKLLVPIATVGGKVIYKTGGGVEFVGAGGAKTVQDLLDQQTPSQETTQSESNQSTSR